MKRQTGKRREKTVLSILTVLALFLCLGFLIRPVRAESVPDSAAPGDAEDVTTTADTGETTGETEPEGPVYHEAVEIPLSSPFTYGNVTEDLNLVFVTSSEKPINLRGGAGTDYPIVGYTQKWQSFRQLDTETDATGKIWYKVLIELETESYEGYISSSVSRSVFLKAEGDVFAAYLVLMGFPESYASRLSTVHAQYPKWFFVPTYTGLEWSDVLYAECNPDHAVGINLVYMPSALSSFMSMEHDNFNWATNSWKPYDTGAWTLASDELVAFYLDPRNFLSAADNSIFLFLNLLYDGTQTEEGVRKIVQGTFMEDGKHLYGENFSYPAEFLRIGREQGISPYYLAATVRQEVGPKGSGSVSGSYQGNLAYYSGIYNYYNIGSFTHDGMTAVESGLQWASTTPSGSNPYDRPWNNRIRALEGGAKHFVYNYIGRGQYTFYYKKFNVIGDQPYTHQYMTNVAGAYSEAIYFGRAYDAQTRDAILSFDIPVYSNMPASPCPRPTKNGNPNTRLKSLSVEGGILSPALDLQETSYTAAVCRQPITITAETIDANAKAVIEGNLTLSEGENRFTITVTAENGDVRTYELNVYYEDVGELVPNTEYKLEDQLLSGVTPGTTAAEFRTKFGFENQVSWKLLDASGMEKEDGAVMKTGDLIQAFAPNGAPWYSAAVLIYGDVNGDGMINISDLIKVRNHILKDNLLTDLFALAGDVNRDTIINISDLIKIRNHILGENAIPQTD